MRLPRKINAGGIAWTVKQHRVKRPRNLGQLDYKSATLHIYSDAGAKLQTCCHEMVHAWLNAIGQVELSDDEAFVDSLASQVATTIETWGARSEE